jgi:hypothetical protein
MAAASISSAVSGSGPTEPWVPHRDSESSIQGMTSLQSGSEGEPFLERLRALDHRPGHGDPCRRIDHRAHCQSLVDARKGNLNGASGTRALDLRADHRPRPGVRQRSTHSRGLLAGPRARIAGTRSASTAVGTGAPDRIRTCDLRLRRPTLYPLSYRRAVVLGQIDRKPEADALSERGNACSVSTSPGRNDTPGAGAESDRA